jgi:hypothetical protein
MIGGKPVLIAIVNIPATIKVMSVNKIDFLGKGPVKTKI